MRSFTVFGSVAVGVAIALAGCGTSDGPKVATAQSSAANPGGAAAGSAPAKESDYDKALRYTRCMTENGEPMPDPVEGKPLPIGKAGDSWQPLSSAAFEKCRHFLPTTWPVKVDLDEVALHRPWGECMKQHGVQVPELNPDANGVVQSQPDPTLVYTPEWRAAEAACRHLDNPGSIPLSDG